MIHNDFLEFLRFLYTSVRDTIAPYFYSGLGSLIGANSIPFGLAWCYGFAAGVSVAHVGGHAIIEHFKIDEGSWSASGILFVSGLFGLTLALEIKNKIPLFIDAALEKWKAR